MNFAQAIAVFHISSLNFLATAESGLDTGLNILSGVFPFLLCALLGAFLAVGELIEAFDRWFWQNLLNRYVLGYTLQLVFLNGATAVVVYAMLRYVMGIEGGLQLAIATGLTFPTLLRTRFTLYRSLDKAADLTDQDAFTLTLDRWYRPLQNACYGDLQSVIAAERNLKAMQIREQYTTEEIYKKLYNQIRSYLDEDQRADLQKKLEDARNVQPPEDPQVWLALLAVDLLPAPLIRRLFPAKENL